MTITIAIGNAAGSAGKTTSAVALAALIAQTHRRVLLVDADAQATSSMWLGIQPTTCATTIGNVLLKEADIHQALITETSAEGVALIPASTDLDGQIQRLATMTGAEQRIRLALKSIDTDVVIIDCPGAVSIMTVAALVAADHAITVAMPTMKEIQGIPRFIQVIHDVAEAYNNRLQLDAVIPCRVPAKNAGRLYRDALDLMHDQPWAKTITPSVRNSVKVPESYALQIPVTTAYPGTAVTLDYLAVTYWLIDQHIL